MKKDEEFVRNAWFEILPPHAPLPFDEVLSTSTKGKVTKAIVEMFDGETAELWIRNSAIKAYGWMKLDGDIYLDNNQWRRVTCVGG